MLEDKNESSDPNKSSSLKGFASMDPERQKEIARRGGKAAHESGHAHRFSTAEARAAGQKGGKSVSQNRAHMAEIGRKGGEARRKNKNKEQQG